MFRRLNPVWKALSDPTRRRLLDLLKQGPRTTGHLCRHFRVSRFAVMKHLGVLEGAGLVLFRRQGRERWNHLNAVPLQQIYERWISPYEAHWASSLLRLKHFAETEKGERADMPEATKTAAVEVGAMHIEQEVKIEASPSRVFEALTKEVAAWWGPPYHLSKTPQGLVLEPKLGGSFYEVWGNGDGVLWATVTSLKRGERLEMTGPMGMSGAVEGRISFTLEPQGKATVVKLSHRAVGEVTDWTRNAYGQGWQDLIGVRLKAYVETGKRYGLGCEPPPGAPKFD